MMMRNKIILGSLIAKKDGFAFLPEQGTEAMEASNENPRFLCGSHRCRLSGHCNGCRAATHRYGSAQVLLHDMQNADADGYVQTLRCALRQ